MIDPLHITCEDDFVTIFKHSSHIINPASANRVPPHAASEHALASYCHDAGHFGEYPH